MAGKMKAPTRPVVVTANRLTDGHVVWLTEDAGWSEAIADARIFDPADAEAGIAAALHDEARQIIVAPYTTEMDTAKAGETDQGRQPIRFRERIRANGPSILFLPQDA